MTSSRTSANRTTIAVSRDRLLELHRDLRQIDGLRAQQGKPRLELRAAVDLLLSLAHTDYVQQLLIQHLENLERGTSV